MARRWQELAWRLLPGSLVAIVFGSLSHLGWLKSVEHLAYNQLFRLRGPQGGDDRVVIVAIDDHSIQRLGRYPWSRRTFTQLMQQLNQATGNVVVFDVIFSEAAPEDAGFGAAIEQHGKVVLASALDANGLPLLPIKPLRERAVGIGHIVKSIDGDGISRSLPLSLRGEDSLSWAAVQTYGLMHTIPQYSTQPAKVWLNWVGPARQIRQYSFVDVLNRQVSPQQFQNKIIFVGITATGFDTLSTPFDRDPPVTGVYLHATATQNLLQQSYLQPIQRDAWEWAGLLIMPGFGLLLSVLRTEWQVGTIGFTVLGILGIGVACLQGYYWLPIALPISLVISTGAMVGLTERLRMNRLLHHQVLHLWQSYPSTMMTTVKPTRQPQPTTSRPWLRLPSSQPRSLLVLQELATIADYLGQAQASQTAIAQTLSIGIVSADRAGQIWFINPLARQWLQLQVGDNLTDCIPQNWFTAEDWQTLTQPPNQPAQASLSFPWERELEQGDRWFWLKLECLDLAVAEFSSYPAQNLLLLLEDITARKHIEANLAKQNQELQWLGQLKDDFIGTISQELRAPVTDMLFAIEQFKIATDSTQPWQYIQQIETAALRQRNFINDLLSFQTPTIREKTQLQQLISLQMISLQTWLPDMIAPFQSRAATRQQTIDCQLDPNLPPLLTHLVALERIVRELLTNACKYTPAGQSILVKATRADNNLQIAVQNFGVEIPLEEQSRIFEKFYRIPQTDPWKQGGTGLGLAIVKRLSTQIGGTIEVDSQAGFTQFQLTLPLSLPLSETAPD